MNPGVSKPETTAATHKVRRGDPDLRVECGCGGNVEIRRLSHGWHGVTCPACLAKRCSP